jgi:hypothetical protein
MNPLKKVYCESRASTDHKVGIINNGENMMRNRWLILIGVLIIGTLVACGSTSDRAVAVGSADLEEIGTGKVARLRDDYNDALSIQGQLAAGTLMLEETDLAIDEALATELLPLWQAMQSLSNSDTTAAAEIVAVLNQIQDTMAMEQVAAIAEMMLTEDSLTTMLEEGVLTFVRGGFGERSGAGGQGIAPGEGFPGGGFPGGGFPGGRPSSGPGGAFQGIDPDAIATRQAQFAESGAATFQERALVGAMVRLMGTKTGEISPNAPSRLFETAFEVVSQATGLSPQDIQAQTNDGTTLAEIVEANDGDIEAVHAALVEALNDLPNAANLDLEQLASQWLGLDQ